VVEFSEQASFTVTQARNRSEAIYEGSGDRNGEDTSTKGADLGFIVFLCLFFRSDVTLADNIYVASVGTNTIEEFDSSGNESTFGTVKANSNSDLAFDARGNLYASSPNRKYL